MAPLILYLVLVSTIGDGLLAGAGLDYMIKQLPARHRIGIAAYAEYFKASDLANGRFWYIPLGVGMYVINIASGIAASVTGVSNPAMILVYLAAGFTIVHLIGTIKAAPAGLRVLRIAPDDEATLARTFQKFARWSYQRGVAGVAMFIIMLWALILIT